jgi:XRE family transcriptional regulator, regulator of sulfur utilization
MPEPTPPPLTLAARLERLRLERGLGVNELARRAGLGPGQLWEILRGKRDPRFSTVVKIVRALGCTLADLDADAPENSEEGG